jgi:pyrroline-5-carboxylate reductase
MKEINKVIGFIGAGNMATALISGLVNGKHDPSRIIASSPEEEHLKKLSNEYGINTTHNNLEILELADVVILAVKPNIISSVLEEIKEKTLQKDHLFISIAAGIKIEKLESLLKESARVIRAMPNTPASIMEGVTAIAPNKNARPLDIENAKLLFESVGTVAEIKEKDIDIFTALIGSGPAYVFYLIESLLESSESLELPKEEKINLLASMISGSANLAKQVNDSPESLRKKVTSPGGVTQRAIEEFEINNLKNLIKKSMKVAEKKSIELGES